MSTVEQAQADLTAAQAAYNAAIDTQFEQLHAVLKLAVSNDPLEALGTRAGDTLAESLIAKAQAGLADQASLRARELVAQSDDQRPALLEDARGRNFVWLLGDREGDVGRQQDLQHALDEIDRHYGTGAAGTDSPRLGKERLAFFLVSQIERASRVVQSVIRHVLAPSSVVGEGSVAASPVAPRATGDVGHKVSVHQLPPRNGEVPWVVVACTCGWRRAPLPMRVAASSAQEHVEREQ